MVKPSKYEGGGGVRHSGTQGSVPGIGKDGWTSGWTDGWTDGQRGQPPWPPCKLPGASLTSKVSEQAQVRESQVCEAKVGGASLQKGRLEGGRGGKARDAGASFQPVCLILEELAPSGNSATFLTAPHLCGRLTRLRNSALSVAIM